MTPKKEAERLVERFKANHLYLMTNSKNNLVYPYKSGFIGNKCREIQAKQCALICVEEIIESGFGSRGIEYFINKNTSVVTEPKKYWQEVKQEIEKL